MAISQFFVPYQFNLENKTCLQSAVEFVDSYFYFGGEKTLITQIDGENLIAEKIEGHAPLLSTCLKVLSYFLVILPCLALVTKYFLREMLPVYPMGFAIHEIIVPPPVINQDRKTIHAAIAQGREAVMTLVKEGKVDLSASDNVLVNWAALNGDIELTRLLLLDPKVDPSEVLENAALSKQTTLIYALLGDRKFVPVASYWLIEWAIENGEKGIDALLQNPNFRSDPKSSSRLVEWACSQNKPGLLRALLAHPAIYPEMEVLSRRLIFACEMGDSEVALVLMLVKTIDYTAENCQAFKFALKNGLTEVVESFMEHIDPAFEDNYAIKNVENGTIAKLLLADPRVIPTQVALDEARANLRHEVEEALIRDGRIEDALPVLVINE